MVSAKIKILSDGDATDRMGDNDDVRFVELLRNSGLSELVEESLQLSGNVYIAVSELDGYYLSDRGNTI